MARVLICTVGGQSQPVVNAVEQNRSNAPLDRVYFLCSTGSDPAASDATIEHASSRKIRHRCSHCKRESVQMLKNPPLIEQARLSPEQYVIERVAELDELAHVLQACDRIERHIRSDWTQESVEVLANYTGGTKTMSFGLGLAAIRKGWSLQLNTTGQGRPNLTRIERGDLVLPQDVSTLGAQDAEQRALQLWEQHNFEGGVSILTAALSQLVLSGPDKQRLLALQRRCALWVAWDRFEYGTARELARQDPELRAAHGRTLAVLDKTVSLMMGNEPWPRRGITGLELIRDLQANAQRCAARARFDDAVCRLFRATELLAQIRLRSRYAIRTDDIDPQSKAIPGTARQWLEAHRSTQEEGVPSKIRIGLVAAYRLLEEMNDPLGAYYGRRKSWLLNALSMRNGSFLAHGLTPIGPESWRSVGAGWQEWLTQAMQSL